MTIQVRPATMSDLPTIYAIRLSVRENRLADDSAITARSSVPYVEAGSMWVATLDDRILGFAALDAVTASVWALFVDPMSEGLGVGRSLHETLINAACERRMPRMTLTTSPGTRAERFYRAAGWTALGLTDRGEILFERLTD